MREAARFLVKQPVGRETGVGGSDCFLGCEDLRESRPLESVEMLTADRGVSNLEELDCTLLGMMIVNYI